MPNSSTKLNLADEVVTTSVGWYVDNGPDKLSHNWDIIEFEEI